MMQLSLSLEKRAAGNAQHPGSRTEAADRTQISFKVVLWPEFQPPWSSSGEKE